MIDQVSIKDKQPIVILDDEEEKQELKKSLEMRRNHNIISEGSFTGSSFDLCKSVAMTKIEGPRKVKEDKVKDAIIKFFSEKLKIRIDFQFFRPRVDPDPENIELTIIPNVAVIYGCDFMKDRILRNIFKSNRDLEQFVWINESSFFIPFGSQEELQQFLKEQLENPEDINIKNSEGDSSFYKGWYTLKKYEVYDFKRPLYMRYANSTDGYVKPVKDTSGKPKVPKDPNNKYRQYEQTRKKLELYLLLKFNAKEDFERFSKEIEDKRNMERAFNRDRSRERQRKPYHEDKSQEKDYMRKEKINHNHNPSSNNNRESLDTQKRVQNNRAMEDVKPMQEKPKQDLNTSIVMHAQTESKKKQPSREENQRLSRHVVAMQQQSAQTPLPQPHKESAHNEREQCKSTTSQKPANKQHHLNSKEAQNKEGNNKNSGSRNNDYNNNRNNESNNSSRGNNENKHSDENATNNENSNGSNYNRGGNNSSGYNRNNNNEPPEDNNRSSFNRNNNNNESSQVNANNRNNNYNRSNGGNNNDQNNEGSNNRNNYNRNNNYDNNQNNDSGNRGDGNNEANKEGFNNRGNFRGDRGGNFNRGDRGDRGGDRGGFRGRGGNFNRGERNDNQNNQNNESNNRGSYNNSMILPVKPPALEEEVDY